MIYKEKKIKNKYEYELNEIFGDLVIHSDFKLDGNHLDDITMLLLKANLKAEKITGDVKLEQGVVSYNFIRRPMWEGEEEEKQCKNTHTLIKKPEREYSLTRKLTKKVSSWLKKLEEVFQ
jgi:hypothetical protein